MAVRLYLRAWFGLGVLTLIASACGSSATSVGSARVVDAGSPAAMLTPSATTPTTTTSTSLAASDEADDVTRRTRTAGGTRSAGARVREDGTPLFEGDFADPFVLVTDGTFTAYATNTFTANVPTMQTDPGGGGFVGDALPVLPVWSEPGWVWAPSVVEIEGSFVMYYTSRHSASGRQCIGVAVAADPIGPFVDTSTDPLVCDLNEGGSIDPSPFVDLDGSLWLLWKGDGNCCGLPTRIFAQLMTDYGLSVAGDPVELIRNDLSWERDVVEGPTMIEHEGVYHLFYSANRWDTSDYVIGHAVCESPEGPCVKDVEPWLGDHDSATGPGGPEVVSARSGNASMLVYHAWTEGAVGYDDGYRNLYVTVLRFEDGQPVTPRLGA